MSLVPIKRIIKNKLKEVNLYENKKINVFEETMNIKDKWKNFVVSNLNDHVVRLSVLQKDFHWHSHDISDEMFYVIEGKLLIDFEDRTEELLTGEMITVPKGVKHRTRSEDRTLLLCFEHAHNDVKGDN